MSKKTFFRVLTVFFCLYAFLFSITLMGGSFKLFGSDFAEQLIRSCSNPYAGLFIGILTTSIVQSSSTTTSLVVGMVGGGILPVVYAIPIIMGANIGTTVTNILVSFTFVTRRDDFRRAFAGATVHDFFNIFSVAVLFPLEIRFHFIQHLAEGLTQIFVGVGGAQFTSPLKMIINPLLKGFKHLLLDGWNLSDFIGGIIMLVTALVMMVVSLIFIVKLMRSLIIGKAEVFMHRFLFRNDLSAMILGMLMTVAVQSSSITTSLIVPLVGAGILSLKRCYPFTLGANIGTTCTALLASLATITIIKGEGVYAAGVTVAFAHLMFNVCGIAIFYPLRKIPIWCAERLADVAAKSRAWAVVFVLGIFFLIPLLTLWIAQ